MSKNNDNLIGLLGGSFDPPHIGHIKISKIAIKKLKLKKKLWIITKKNPLKHKPFFSIKERIKLCKKITSKYKKIEVKYIENKSKSSRFIDNLKYLKKKLIKVDFYTILGSDSLIEFHKWKNWREIGKMSEFIVFSRKGFEKKSKNSLAFKFLFKKKALFVKNRYINVSSSKIKSIIKTKTNANNKN